MGADLFGPFTISNKSKELKRYGVMFTCLSSHAIHLEIANSLETESFLVALRKFIGYRTNSWQMHSDNDSNFVGAIRELRKSFYGMDHKHIQQYIQTFVADEKSTNKIHKGGFWECQTKTTRSILYALTLLMSISHFYTPWKPQRTKGFLTFSGGIKMGHWHEKS